MSGFTEGTQAAHLCPRSEDAWFQRNEMSRYNLNPLLVSQGPLEDTANALLLRQDLHTHFDAHKFVFVPKRSKCMGHTETETDIPIVAHLLMASRELALLHHNVRLKPIPDVEVAFLFARFAWSMFTLLTGFLRVGVERRLIGTTISSPSGGLPRLISAVECRAFVGPGGLKSRSQSPTKRLRRGEDVDDELEGEEELDSEGEGSERALRIRKKRKTRDEAIRPGEEGFYEGSESAESSSKAILTPRDTCTEEVNGIGIDTLRQTWLLKERLRSDPEKKWEEEETWAMDIKDAAAEKVMGPGEVRRYYSFMGYELFGEEDGI